MTKNSSNDKTLDELKKEVRYKCDNCGSVNNYSITFYRDEEPIYAHHSLEQPSHYFFNGQWIEVQCTRCGEDLTPRDEDFPPIKKRGIYSYYSND